MKQAVMILIWLSCYTLLFAQKPEPNYKQLYPIGEDADILFKTSYVKSETILFEANPIVRYSFYNNIERNLLKAKNHAYALYVAFKPQLRMYTDNSLPVKMPSYKVQLGYQQLFRVKEKNFFSVALESGHYSNGQSGCAFSELYDDGSHECDSVYSLITSSTDLSKILNRKNGNFSTNLTELVFNYRINSLDGQQRIAPSHSLTLGLNLYHDRFWGLFDFGGYSDNDIKIYGSMRYNFSYAYNFLLKSKRSDPPWLSLSENLELIQGAHPSVKPVRSVTAIKYYPIGKFREFGVSVSYIYGHDNYNYRFVDAGNQVAFGLAWSVFSPFQIQTKE